MKKLFIVFSVLCLLAWVVGLFLKATPPAMHILVVVSILLYIRSIMVISEPVTT